MYMLNTCKPCANHIHLLHMITNQTLLYISLSITSYTHTMCKQPAFKHASSSYTRP